MYKQFLIAGAVFGATGVAFGAFGAHGLQKITTDEKILHGYQTAVQYQLYHALALLAVGIIYERIPQRLVRLSGTFFITGILLFSGSLYLLTISQIQKADWGSYIGGVTPLGGLFLIAAWLFLLLGVVRKK